MRHIIAVLVILAIFMTAAHSAKAEGTIDTIKDGIETVKEGKEKIDEAAVFMTRLRWEGRDFVGNGWPATASWIVLFVSLFLIINFRKKGGELPSEGWKQLLMIRGGGAFMAALLAVYLISKINPVYSLAFCLSAIPAGYMYYINQPAPSSQSAGAGTADPIAATLSATASAASGTTSTPTPPQRFAKIPRIKRWGHRND